MSAHHPGTGLAVLGLLSVADLALPVLTNGSNPAHAVAIFGAALCAVSLVVGAAVVARRPQLEAAR